MAPSKAERLMNLTICLLVARGYVTREQIRENVIGYRGNSDAAFERMFERDKDELRRLGIPIEVGSYDPAFDDEGGYRIPRADYELPHVQFTPGEATALSLAAGAWRQTSVDGDTGAAITKLRAAQVPLDPGRLTALNPQINAREPAFDALWEAAVQRQEVAFAYRTESLTRRVQPWSVIWRRGSWYLVGWDLDRQDERLFKMSRIIGLPEITSGPDGYQLPDDFDVAAVTQRLGPPEPDSWATLAIREGAAPALTRVGQPADWTGTLPEGYRAYRVPYASEFSFVDQIAEAGANAVVLEPAELAEAVRAHLLAFVSHHEAVNPGGQR